MDSYKFSGIRSNLKCSVIVKYEHKYKPELNDKYTLPLYLNEVNHSPDGFNWGYGGSGPSQLAYAILRELTSSYLSENFSKRISYDYYWVFRNSFIEQIAGDFFEINGDEIKTWITEVIRFNSKEYGFKILQKQYLIDLVTK